MKKSAMVHVSIANTQRLVDCLSENPMFAHNFISKRQAKLACQAGRVAVNGAVYRNAAVQLAVGDVVQWTPGQSALGEIKSEGAGEGGDESVDISKGAVKVVANAAASAPVPVPTINTAANSYTTGPCSNGPDVRILYTHTDAVTNITTVVAYKPAGLKLRGDTVVAGTFHAPELAGAVRCGAGTGPGTGTTSTSSSSQPLVPVSAAATAAPVGPSTPHFEAVVQHATGRAVAVAAGHSMPKAACGLVLLATCTHAGQIPSPSPSSASSSSGGACSTSSAQEQSQLPLALSLPLSLTVVTRVILCGRCPEYCKVPLPLSTGAKAGAAGEAQADTHLYLQRVLLTRSNRHGHLSTVHVIASHAPYVPTQEFLQHALRELGFPIGKCV